jgi:small subunit ribosomal protein S16
MALKIRLRRMGRKKAPHYRIVVAESSMPRDGRFVANVGHYNPTTNPATLVVNRDLALSWLGKGATPTDTVQSLFKKAGVYGPAPTVVETAAAAVSGAAGKAAGAVKEAAAAVAETASSAAAAVVETVRDAAEAVAERVTGGDEEAAPAADPAAPAEGEQPQG